MYVYAFSALTLLVGWPEGHQACKNWVVRYWHGYLSGARCKWFAYTPSDATATPSSLATVKSRMVYLSSSVPTTRVPCSNAAKTRKTLKFAGVPQTHQQISAVSRPKFTILWGHVGRYRCLTSFFRIVDACLSCEGTARQSCAMMPKWQFLRPVFSASRVQHISDMHSKFALRPHHVWKYGRHPICDCWD